MTSVLYSTSTASGLSPTITLTIESENSFAAEPWLWRIAPPTMAEGTSCSFAIGQNPLGNSSDVTAEIVNLETGTALGCRSGHDGPFSLGKGQEL